MYVCTSKHIVHIYIYMHEHWLFIHVDESNLFFIYHICTYT